MGVGSPEIGLNASSSIFYNVNVDLGILKFCMWYICKWNMRIMAYINYL